MKRNVGIAGVGFYVPEKVLTNKDLEKSMDTTDEWIQEKIGIKERRVAAEDEALSDLAYPAALQALEMSGVTADEIDLILVCAINHDKRLPSTACILQKMLKASNAAAFDVNVGGCPGTGYALVIGQQFVENGMYDRVLVISGEIYSKMLDWSDRDISVFFGDGVGAAVLKPCKENTGFLSSLLGADGEWGVDNVLCEGGSRISYSKEMVEDNLHRIEMNNKEVWKFATKIFPQTIRDVTKKAEFELTDLDWIIPHQANINMIRYGMNEMGLPMSKTYTNLDRIGNTGAGSVIIALADAVQKGLIKPGQNIALSSFGAGFSWGAVLTRWCSEEDFIA
ncbi:beta-ketoacyl-ACP synthase III [Wukongibacter baidiensis]|uniref:3-oxoacyl-ACP synthase III family protein n=1 Tax=Wukongibacter baidiensis TaxID=1723361 RepID=UPI003D7FB4D6